MYTDPILQRIDLRRRRLSEKLVFAEGGASTIRLALAPNMYTTELTFFLKAKITTQTGVSLKPHTLWRLIKSLTVTGTTTHYIDIGNPLALAAYVISRDKDAQMDTVSSSAGTGEYTGIWTIHCGLGAVTKAIDLSAPLPDETVTTNLLLIIDWGKSSDLGSAVTVEGAEITIIQSCVTLTPTQVNTAFKTGIRYPLITTDEVALTALKGNLTQRFTIPIKALVNKTTIGVVDNTDAFSNKPITELGIINTVESSIAFQVPFISEVNNTMRRSDLLSMPTGIVVIEWGEYLSGIPEVGLDTRRLASNEIQIAATVEELGTVYLIHTSVGKVV